MARLRFAPCWMRLVAGWGKTAFRLRIDPANTASQRLFEKLGARPNGVSEFLLHDEEAIMRCEETNLPQVDGRLIALAEKFGVEP